MKRLTNARVREQGRTGYSLQRDGITQGLIMTYLKCRVEFLLRLNKWGPLQEKTVFANGSITHDTLDKVYTYFQWYKKLPSLLLIKSWIYTYEKSNPNWLANNPKSDHDSIKAVCFVVVTEYIRFYKEDFTKYKIIGAEDIFDLQWNGYRLRGKKDLRYYIRDEKWLMETKTMARIDEAELQEKISFDFQSGFYVCAEDIEVPAESVKGVLYNVIRNPGHKIGKNESLFTFQNRLRREIRKDPKHFFKRWHIPYTTKDKLEFKVDLLHILQEIDSFLHGDLRVYRNSKNCVTRFKCTFLKACASGILVGYINNYPIFKELGEED